MLLECEESVVRSILGRLVFTTFCNLRKTNCWNVCPETPCWTSLQMQLWPHMVEIIRDNMINMFDMQCQLHCRKPRPYHSKVRRGNCVDFYTYPKNSTELCSSKDLNLHEYPIFPAFTSFHHFFPAFLASDGLEYMASICRSWSEMLCPESSKRLVNTNNSLPAVERASGGA